MIRISLRCLVELQHSCLCCLTDSTFLRLFAVYGADCEDLG